MTTVIKDLLNLGHSIWEYTYRKTDNDLEALELLKDHFLESGLDPRGLLSMQTISIWLFAGRWVQQGAPRVVLDDQLAASLMATDVGLEQAEFIQPPWKAFVIDLPPGLLVHEAGGKVRSSQRISVQYAVYDGGPQWIYWVNELDEEGEPGIFVKATTKKLIQDHWDNVEGIDDQYARINRLVGRLITSLCLALSDPTTTTLRERKRSKGRGNKFRTPHRIPDTRDFVVGRSITIDCRQAIRDYVEGGGKRGPIRVQTLVRGHWKHQVHGTNRALRKLIHIEPYWKGPEEAKILLRPVRPQVV